MVWSPPIKTKPAELDPTDFDLPFIQEPDRKLSLTDVEAVLSSHYQNTPYDPLGHGSDADKHRFSDRFH